jgi:lathosterol oxidase
MDLLLDKVWAYLVPMPTTTTPPESLYIPATSAWPRDYIPRQILSLIVLTLIGIHLLYFVFAGLSFKFIFNHDMMRHPRFLKNQINMEIQCSMKAFPFMTLLTLPWFQAEVMGLSRMYDDVGKYGWTYLVLSVPL